MLASQENASDSELLVVIDTMLELSTEVIAHKPAPQLLLTHPPPLSIIIM